MKVLPLRFLSPMTSFSREAVLFGATQIVSGLIQVIFALVFLRSVWFFDGSFCMGLGATAILLGHYSTFETKERPLGITLIALSYGSIGLLSIFAGGWLFAPLLLVAFVCFAVSWGLFKRKAWAWEAALAISILGLLISVGLGTAGILLPVVGALPVAPSVISGAYMLWYLNRSHVAGFFGKQPNSYSDLKCGKKVIVMLLLSALILSYFFINPPGGTVISAIMVSGGSQGNDKLGSPAGGTGKPFHAGQDDLLDYTFQSAGGQAHFWVTQEVDETTRVTIAENLGVNASGSVKVPQTGQYMMWVCDAKPGEVSVQCELRVTWFSLRASILSWLLLILYGVLTLFFPELLPSKRLWN